jgi:hypothetical protein
LRDPVNVSHGGGGVGSTVDGIGRHDHERT